MGSLSPSYGPLMPEHRRVLGWLRRAKDAPVAHDDSKIALDEMSTSTLNAARGVWARRMINEHTSAAVFAGLIPQLMRCGAPLEYLTTALRASADELHHGALCADVVRALGVEPPDPPRVDARALPNPPALTPLEVAMRNILFVGCMAETVAVAFTAEEREQTSEPFVKSVITQISADEVLHARFGWAFVKELAPELDDAARSRLNAWLPLAFAYLEREEMLEVPDVTPADSALLEEGQALGVCDNRATRQLFYETVTSSIIPGLEAAGFEAKVAWRRRQEHRISAPTPPPAI